jgi:hypothetical protein
VKTRDGIGDVLRRVLCHPFDTAGYARSRDMLAMLAVAGSGADARPANPSAIKAAVNA